MLTAKAALHNQKSLRFTPRSKINTTADKLFFEDIGRYKAAKGKSEKGGVTSQVLEKGDETRALAGGVIVALKNMKAFVFSDSHFVVADGNVSSTAQFPETYFLPAELEGSLNDIVTNIYVSISCLSTRVSQLGHFGVSLSVKGKPFLGLETNKLVATIPKGFVKNILLVGNEASKWKVTSSKEFLSIRTRQANAFFIGAGFLNDFDSDTAAYYQITKLARNDYTRAILAAILRPLRFRNGEPKGVLRGKDEIAKSAARLERIKKHRSGAINAALILNKFDKKYVKIIQQIYTEFTAIELWREVARIPPMQIELGIRWQAILGLGLSLGYIYDPNNGREFLKVNVSAALGVKAGLPEIDFKPSFISASEIDELRGTKFSASADFTIVKGGWGPFEIEINGHAKGITTPKLTVLEGKISLSKFYEVLQNVETLDKFLEELSTIYDGGKQKEKRDQQKIDGRSQGEHPPSNTTKKSKPKGKDQINLEATLIKVDIGVVDIQIKVKSKLSGGRLQVGFNSEFFWTGVEPVDTGFGEAIYAYFNYVQGYTLLSDLQEKVHKLNEGFAHPAIAKNSFAIG